MHCGCHCSLYIPIFPLMSPSQPASTIWLTSITPLKLTLSVSLWNSLLPRTPLNLLGSTSSKHGVQLWWQGWPLECLPIYKVPGRGISIEASRWLLSLNWFGSAIDGVFLIWTHGEEQLDNFISYCNTRHQTINFTAGKSKKSLSSLMLWWNFVTDTWKPIFTLNLPTLISTKGSLKYQS